MKDFSPQPDSSMMTASLQVQRGLDGQGKFFFPKHQLLLSVCFVTQSLFNIYPCAGSGDMKVMQFKVETGQKVLDLKVDSSNCWI